MANLGDKVKDKVTGFTGVVMCRSVFLNGCVRLTVQAQKLDKDNKTIEQYFDEPQVDVVSVGVVSALPEYNVKAPRATGGGPQQPTPRWGAKA